MSVIYENGTILTMNEDCPTVESIMIENGLLAKCGTKKDVISCKKEDTVVIDLQGKTLMPGFIDGHSHFSGLATSLSQCDLSGAKDFHDIICKMKEFIVENQISKGQWVIGTNYDHNFLIEKKHPDKTVLDAISIEHPIVVVHASSHMGAANSKGLELQGIVRKTQDPKGGHYGREADGKEPNGYMEENAFVQFRNHMPMPELKDIMKNFKKAQEIYASYGITTVQEGMVTEPLFQILQYAEKQNVFYLDLVGYIDFEHCKDLLLKHSEYRNHYKNHVRMGGYKIFLDGSPQGRTAWMKEPYQHAEDGYRGYPIHEDEQLYQMVCEALKNHQQLLAHCNGDAAAEQYIKAFERVQKEHPEYVINRPVMIHAQLVQKDQLERMKKISMIPSFFLAHVYYWGDIHVKNFGMKRAEHISPVGTAKNLGLLFTFHQDSPVLMPDVFQSIWCGVSRRTKEGVLLSEKEKITVYDGLKAMTIDAAYQYGEEKSKGTIEEGKKADLIILEQNPLEVPECEIKNIRVLETLKDGKVVYRRKKDRICFNSL